MKHLLFLLIFLSQTLFAQNHLSKRSNGDLLNGTWKCVRCSDTTLQSITFEDTLFRYTVLSPEGLKTTVCPYKLKRNKIFIQCEDKKEWHYRIDLLDYNSLELTQFKKGNEQFKKTLN
jgi:hypothetical protein